MVLRGSWKRSQLRLVMRWSLRWSPFRLWLFYQHNLVWNNRSKCAFSNLNLVRDDLCASWWDHVNMHKLIYRWDLQWRRCSTIGAYCGARKEVSKGLAVKAPLNNQDLSCCSKRDIKGLIMKALLSRQGLLQCPRRNNKGLCSKGAAQSSGLITIPKKMYSIIGARPNLLWLRQKDTHWLEGFVFEWIAYTC